jgi:hypothetical protein
MNEKTLSHCQGTGSIAHNNRDFKAKNVDSNRTKDNIIFFQEPIEQAYEKCFGEAVERYNAKQKRNDRKIKNGYFEHTFKHKPCNTVVTSSDKRKSFYEDLVQIGTMDDTGIGTADSEVAIDCLFEYMMSFRERNPNLYVFNAVMHLDEATPHLHIDYIPIGHYNRGVDTQNSISQAMKEMGFDYAKDSINQWRLNERKILESICQRHGIKIAEPKKSRGYSFTVDEYKEYKSTIDGLKEEQTQVAQELQQTTETLNTVKSELKPMLNLSDKLKKISNIGETKQVGVFKKSTVHTLTDEEFKKLKSGYNKYVANRDKIVSLDKRERQLNQREANLMQDIKQQQEALRQKSAEAEQMKSKYETLYNKQVQLNFVNKALELGCKDYKEQISTLNDTISANQVTINILNSNLEHAYRLIAETVEALNMLKYDKELGYGVKLTEEADTLLKAIERHSLRFLNRNNQQDLAEQVKSTAKISEYIQNIIDELNPPPTATKDKSYDLSL